MTKQNQIYKCDICGNTTNILHVGVGEMVCCDQPMILQIEKSSDAGKEKHLPVIKDLPENVCRGKDGVVINIGEIKHPMNDEHYIEWIELVSIDNKVGRRFLKPGDKPEVEFYTRDDIREVRAYCNIHGLWKLAI